MSEISIEQAYRKMQAECGIEVGDKVKIVRGYKADEAVAMGFSGTGMCREFNSSVGKILTVTRIQPQQILLRWGDENTYINAPFYCLELVEKAKPKLPPIMVGSHEVKFYKDDTSGIKVGEGIKVGCEFVSASTLRQILDRLEN